MLKKIKNLDPNTITLVKVAAVHLAVAAGSIVLTKVIENKIVANAEKSEN